MVLQLLGGSTATASLDDMVFGFPDSGDDSSASSFGSCEDYDEPVGEDQLERRKAFWDEQTRNLLATMYRSNSVESSIREATREAFREAKSQYSSCNCLQTKLAIGSSSPSDCRDCLRRQVCNRLVNLGFDCHICRSKWRTSPSIPSGEHSYLEVMAKSVTKKGEMRVVIELNFRAEFEMARGSEDYNRLIGQLPEVFVGKAERLKALVKILCSAAKRCMKEKNMHMGPWRKHKYMEAKWFASCHRSSPPPLPPVSADGNTAAVAPPRVKASMLTFDLSEAVPMAGLRPTAVAV